MNNPDSHQLENYLAQLRHSGQVDSEGSFTVAGLRAVGKLAAFLLFDESDWLLKIVQAAVLGQASELQIKQTQKSTQIFFNLPFKVELAKFEKTLVSTTTKSPEPGLEHLACGLRAVGVGQLRDWFLLLSSHTERASISCLEGLVSAERQLEQEPVEGTRISVGVAYPQGQHGKVGGLIRFGEAIQHEHSHLLTKARTCPIPLYLDGRRIDDLFEPKMASVLQERAFLGVNTPGPRAGQSIPIPQALRSSESFRVKDRFNPHAPFYLSPRPSNHCASSLQRWYYNYSTSKESLNKKSGFFFQPIPTPSRVYLVRHGVVVGRTSLGIHHPISVDVFLNSEDLRSDLTDLQVEPTDREVEMAKDEIRAAAPFLQHIEQLLAEHSSRPLSQELMLYGGLGTLGLLSPVFAMKAAAGAITAVMLARSAKNHGLLVADCRKQLSQFGGRLS